MSLVVVDASVLAVFYAADDPRRRRAVSRLSAGDALFAPAHLDVEVMSALRGMARRSMPLGSSVAEALRHLAGFPIRRMPLAPLLERMWQLHDNATPYDGAYVALAERLGGPLVTSDAKLAASSGLGCTVDLII